MERPQDKIGEVLFVNLCYPYSYSRSHGTELALKGHASIQLAYSGACSRAKQGGTVFSSDTLEAEL